MSDLEQSFVHETYDRIAVHFSQTRYSPWPCVKNYIDALPVGYHVLDAGCGNGKNMLIRTDIDFIGCDMSENLLSICRERCLRVVHANIKSLPFENESFDSVISIAVLHHLSTREDRIQGLKELLRVLKPGKTLLISVWAREQEMTSKFIPINDDNDFFVTWSADRQEIKRYYHLFHENEVESLLKHGIDAHIVDKSFEKDNWVYVLQK